MPSGMLKYTIFFNCNNYIYNNNPYIYAVIKTAIERMSTKKAYVIGLDFGSDSVRSILVEAYSGKHIGSSVYYYERWSKGYYCDPDKNRFRQHPLDYIQGVEHTVRDVMQNAVAVAPEEVVAISVDTTGSTPVAVNKQGIPLALTEGFEENPNAMFVLWKDHTAIKEAAEINALAKKGDVDYTKYVGGIYSSEWFWAKILHILREDEQVRNEAYGWMEHCDWIPYMLTGQNDLSKLKRSRCAAGHKAMWNENFEGLPPESFFTALDPLLVGLRERLASDTTYTSNEPAGTLSKEWAQRLGLTDKVVIGVGAFDAHMGAVGGEIEPYAISKVIGTSTCDIMVVPQEELGAKTVKGICGQVMGSVIPNMMGLEAGQSAFGDVYAWFKKILTWPVEQWIEDNPEFTPDEKSKFSESLRSHVIPTLSKAAEQLPTKVTGPIALDWFNGRRTPDANQLLKGGVMGLHLGSDAPHIFKALVESTCFGAKKIIDRFVEEGIRIDSVIALGGVSKKSPFVMQTLANILDRPIKVAKEEQTCALGAAMFAAVVAKIYPDVQAAMAGMGRGFDRIYQPEENMVKTYAKIYERYNALADHIETKHQIHDQSL